MDFDATQNSGAAPLHPVFTGPHFASCVDGVGRFGNLLRLMCLDAILDRYQGVRTATSVN